jgi:hypothetical protein
LCSIKSQFCFGTWLLFSCVAPCAFTAIWHLMLVMCCSWCSFYPSHSSLCVHSTIAKKAHVLFHGHTTIAIQVMWIIFMCCFLCSLCHNHLTIFWCFSANVLHDYCTIAKKACSCFSCSLCNSHWNLSNVFYAHFVISIWSCLDVLHMLLVNLALVIWCVALYMMFVNCALVFFSCVVICVLLVDHALIFFTSCFSCVIGQSCCDAFHMF